jgi:hypothetical protein
VTPLAFVEKTPEGERRIAITDAEARAVRSMVMGSVVMLILFAIIRRLAGGMRARAHTSEGAQQ